jgi:hypothetical protein
MCRLPFLHLHFLSNSLPQQRQPCLKASSFSAAPPASTAATGRLPIRVEPKPKHRKCLQNVFLDNIGFPDQSDKYDHVLHDIDGGPILRKLKHPKPDLNALPDPAYHSPFIPKKHKGQMRQDMDLLHLRPDLQEQVYGLIREYWSLFDGKGVFVPVKIMNALSTLATPVQLT